MTVNCIAAIFISIILHLAVPCDTHSAMLELLSPANYQTLEADKIFNIEWQNAYSESQLRLDYSIDGGNSWNLIIESVQPTLGSYQWKVPDIYSSQAIIKLTNLSDNSIVVRPIYISGIEGYWKPINKSASFTPRDGVSLLSYKNRMWLLGGWEGAYTNSEIWSSSDGINWDFRGNAPWPGRHGAGSVATDLRVRS